LDFFEIANVYLPKPNDLPFEQSRLIISTNNNDYYRFKGKIETLLSDLHIPGFCGEIKIDAGNCYWEIPVADLLKQSVPTTHYIPISKFTPIIEDINLTLKTRYLEIANKIKALSPLIKQIELIDKYNDKITLRLYYHSDDKQLSNEDIAPIREQLLNPKF
jgi:phenylalanyl-tRNA synthetase beta subunit